MKLYNKNIDEIPDDAVYIGRGSVYGNPFVIGIHGSRTEVLKRFEKEILPELDVSDLVGKDLVCYCVPKKCHGELIIRKIKKLYPFGWR